MLRRILAVTLVVGLFGVVIASLGCGNKQLMPTQPGTTVNIYPPADTDTFVVFIHDTISVPPPPPDTIIIIKNDSLIIRQVCSWIQSGITACKGKDFKLGSPASTSTLAYKIDLGCEKNKLVVRGHLKYVNPDDHGGQVLSIWAQLTDNSTGIFPGTWNNTTSTKWILPNTSVDTSFTASWTTVEHDGGIPAGSSVKVFIYWGAPPSGSVMSLPTDRNGPLSNVPVSTMWHYEGTDSLYSICYSKVCRMDTTWISRRHTSTQMSPTLRAILNDGGRLVR